MTLTDLFLTQLDLEAESSRRVLERFPEGRNDWKPHPKSMPLGYLAGLVASMPLWIVMTVERDELDLMAQGGDTFKPQPPTTAVALVETHQANVARARAALKATDDEHLAKTWRFLVGGKLINEQPRSTMISNGVFSHLSHHRGQLTVYLRLNEAPVPAIFGPSADEKEF
jgi:uncharacterized damage-inducible protein DinB